MKWNSQIRIGDRVIAPDQPTYFIADIASSHDGELDRAVALIHLAAKAGADCAKFQHFLAKDIVSDEGFKTLGGQSTHQADWKQSVFEVFEKYQTPRDWTDTLVAACAEAGIDYMTTPYDVAALDLMDPVVQAYKIGSGDMGWPQFIGKVAARKKPVFLATGACNQADVDRAVVTVLAYTPQICLMQCNTNYTGALENFKYINLNVLRSYATRWPDMVLGLSDHTPGHATVLGAIALGARAVEKHFTDDNTRDGPDHGFSMNPQSWREMVERSRELELALGDGIKRVEDNECEARIVQRRSLRAVRNLPKGHVLCEADLVSLRPNPEGAMEPAELELAIGRALRQPLRQGEALVRGMLL
ncbi:MAG: N-acetylneuraminate synthase [Robiginitomaculum sp.]|nr:MAG: N-acetylneuraminate synthase [Robiginitomaculum sp.]